MNDRVQFLSEEGQRRREAIADMARTAARARRQKRSRRRAITTLAGVACLCVGVAEWSRHAATPIDPPHVVVKNERTPANPPPIPTGVVVTRIETDPNITARLALPRQPARWRVVGDDDLLRTLAEAGHPAGLVRMNGQAILMLR
jgi:hypothetical protein